MVLLGADAEDGEDTQSLNRELGVSPATCDSKDGKNQSLIGSKRLVADDFAPCPLDSFQLLSAVTSPTHKLRVCASAQDVDPALTGDFGTRVLVLDLVNQVKSQAKLTPFSAQENEIRQRPAARKVVVLHHLEDNNHQRLESLVIDSVCCQDVVRGLGRLAQTHHLDEKRGEDFRE